MKEFINGLTGTRMLVADDREKEYLDAGHKPVRGQGQETAEPHVNMDEQAAGSEETAGAAEEVKPVAPAASKANKPQTTTQKKTSSTQKRKPATKK